MNWVYQVLSFFVAFGPIILGTLLWHLIWNGGSDSSSNPPGGGPTHRPLPPSPSFSGDRLPIEHHPSHAPVHPRKRTSS